ncbi:putative f1f0 atp synthase assembly protein [Diaporthe ampelina]|uniref:Putative f1f0 atp synthase assembly protein n=1 Tax=Diaporthe ampelina TaxID=1214573 RepID=A0A0G2HWA0_9PEZI|nr:putative f1f0 atp synthase assembly protein [Diaporthe ampelina]
MAFTRVPALRNLFSCQLRSLRVSNQRRWAQVHDVRFLATTQASRNVLEKYREKLDAKAREEGHADIQDLKKAYADKIHDIRKKDAAIPGIPPLGQPPAPTNSASADATTTTTTPPPPRGQLTPEAAAAHQAAKPSSYPTNSGVKTLDQILDLPKARTLPVPELTAIWRLRHASSPQALCAVVPQHTYEAMEAEARAHPQFVLPLPHPEQGAEMHFLQWTFDPATRTSTVLFTQLAEYKARGEFAVPHTTVTHHLDLVADKRVVLMQGTVVADRGVKPDDARWLVMCLQRFYGGWDGEKNDALGRERAEERKRLLEWFGKGDSRFSVEKLLEEAERLA